MHDCDKVCCGEFDCGGLHPSPEGMVDTVRILNGVVSYITDIIPRCEKKLARDLRVIRMLAQSELGRVAHLTNIHTVSYGHSLPYDYDYRSAVDKMAAQAGMTIDWGGADLKLKTQAL